MGRLAWVMAAALLVAGYAASGEKETRRIELLNGLYAVEAPSSWWLQEDEGGARTEMAESKDSPNRLIIGTPIPGVRDMPQLMNLLLQATYRRLGGEGHVLSTKHDDTDGIDSIQSIFTVRTPGGANFGGMLDAIDVNGHVVTLMAIGPEDGFGEFLAKAEAVMETYEVDEDALDDNADDIEAIGEATLRDLAAAAK